MEHIIILFSQIKQNWIQQNSIILKKKNQLP